jgi:hypothetical protein
MEAMRGFFSKIFCYFKYYPYSGIVITLCFLGNIIAIAVSYLYRIFLFLFVELHFIFIKLYGFKKSDYICTRKYSFK